MSQALYRKYRSRSLDEVLGQDHVTNILRRALEQGKIAHAYLLTGPRGVGKTSVARILAHEINKLPYNEEASHLDIIEIDAASNNGVDDIRALREKAQVAPVSAPKKIYIIDEVPSQRHDRVRTKRAIKNPGGTTSARSIHLGDHRRRQAARHHSQPRSAIFLSPHLSRRHGTPADGYRRKRGLCHRGGRCTTNR